ncbi:hypothetical protein ACJX0J_010307, partial [Zea mays]
QINTTFYFVNIRIHTIKLYELFTILSNMNYTRINRNAIACSRYFFLYQSLAFVEISKTQVKNIQNIYIDFFYTIIILIYKFKKTKIEYQLLFLWNFVGRSALNRNNNFITLFLGLFYADLVKICPVGLEILTYTP